MHSFTTERLLIRPLAEQDKDLYTSLYTDAKVMRNIGEPLSAESAEIAFNRTLMAMKKEQPKVMTWAIVTLENDQCVGIQALNWQTPAIAEIGIMLVRNSNGKLLPEEAMGALMEYAFSHSITHTIHACYAKSNLATRRFVRKLGFTSREEPELELDSTNDCHEYFKKEQWQKNLIMQVLP